MILKIQELTGRSSIGFGNI